MLILSLFQVDRRTADHLRSQGRSQFGIVTTRRIRTSDALEIVLPRVVTTFALAAIASCSSGSDDERGQWVGLNQVDYPYKVLTCAYEDNDVDWAIGAVIDIGVDELKASWEEQSSQHPPEGGAFRWVALEPMLDGELHSAQTATGHCRALWSATDDSLQVLAAVKDELDAAVCRDALVAVLPTVVNNLADSE